jgi:hypothetical protein
MLQTRATVSARAAGEISPEHVLNLTYLSVAKLFEMLVDKQSGWWTLAKQEPRYS